MANEREHAPVLGCKKFERAATKCLRALALRENAFHPPQQRAAVVLLRFNIQRFILILGIDDYRQIELLWIGSREPGIAVGRPLHGRAHAVTVAKIEVITHADLVAVIDHRGSWQRQQQRVHQFDLAAVVSQQRREPAADAEIDSHRTIFRVHAIHVIALFVGNHF